MLLSKIKTILLHFQVGTYKINIEQPIENLVSEITMSSYKYYYSCSRIQKNQFR